MWRHFRWTQNAKVKIYDGIDGNDEFLWERISAIYYLQTDRFLWESHEKRLFLKHFIIFVIHLLFKMMIISF